MSGEPNVIEQAIQLLNSLYDSGDLSIDQASGISVGLEAARGLLTDLAQYRQANGLAAQAYVQLDKRAAELESQLGQAHELLTILQEAARPAAVILYNLTQLPLKDEHVKETIRRTLAQLDAALAMKTKASEYGL